MRPGLIAALFFIFVASSPLSAQQRPPTAPDPRISGPTIEALQTLLKLREAEMRMMAEDAKTRLDEREKAWADYSAPLWQPAEH